MVYLPSDLWCISRFSGYFMGNSHNNQPGRLYTSLAMLVTGGKRSVALGRKEQADNSLEGFTLVFHYSNILSAVYISESFSWVVFVVHVVFVVLKTTTNFVLQYRKQQIQPIQLPYFPRDLNILVMHFFFCSMFG